MDYYCREDYFQTNFLQNVIADKNSPPLSIGRLIRRIVMNEFFTLIRNTTLIYEARRENKKFKYQ
ncbi:hypothetical protein VISI1226_06293 [Vibrio sinaloensis DSM 21326]|uniref:Uncharacterized protein n=1 Tax=Vibrio sinaloensis DSM 21326 TaxID=945550 RepID=E8M471_PHOS4|nr:hypothetical protein VISI1226_06293 [Vibrio sinaloensis DSM 21326]